MKRIILKSICLFIICVSIAGAARADQDIVYATRYYLNPGKKGLSHFHLYRINPDGTHRMQITNGSGDDSQPRCSPDGKKVMFVRKTGEIDNICIVNSEGGSVETYANAQVIFDPQWNPAGDSISFIQSVEGSDRYWVCLYDLTAKKFQKLYPADDYAWSPDGSKLYVSSEDGGGILDPHTGRYRKIDANLRQGMWLDNNTIIAYQGFKTGTRPSLRILSIDGTILHELPIDIDDPEVTGEGAFPDALYKVPGEPDMIIYGAHAGDSTSGRRELFYLVNLKTGSFRRITDGQYLAWRPDGQRFATGEPRVLSDRESGKKVWTSPLNIVVRGKYTKKAIVSGQVWVDGFDWRR